MKAIAVFLLFLGMFLVVQGYYQQSTACPAPKTEVKYIPYSLYEEQLSDKQKLQTHFKSLFEDATDPWRIQKSVE
jgi:hypothetical protein